MPLTPLDPECCELLRAVVRPESDGEKDLLARFANNVRDWEAAITAANEHGVIPMLYSRLTSNSVTVPAQVFERMRIENESNVFHSLANAAELLEVLRDFDEQKIPVMPFKGIVLAQSMYGNLFSRPAGDLDLLISPRDLERATAVLLKRGYDLSIDPAPLSDELYESHFERRSDGMVIELRWRLELTQPRFRRVLGLDWVWERRQVTTLAGARVPDLDPATALLVLCMHGCKHAWTRLIWVSDVARLLERHANLDWHEVIREARRTGLWRSLALGVLLARRIAAAPVPEFALRRLESDRAARSLASYFDENLLRNRGSIPNGRIPYNIQLLGAEDRIRFLFSMNFLRPTDLDRAFIELPRYLEPVYYVIRPIRLLLDRSPR